MRTILGLILGGLLVFPGAEILRWLARQVFGVYTDMTLTDACLAIIIILQAVIIVRGAWSPGPPRPAARMEMGGARVELRPPRPRPRARPPEGRAPERPTAARPLRDQRTTRDEEPPRPRRRW